MDDFGNLGRLVASKAGVPHISDLVQDTFTHRKTHVVMAEIKTPTL